MDYINVILSFFVLILTYVIYRLTDVMATIAKEDKEERTGHNLSIVLPTAQYNTEEKRAIIRNFSIVNLKNKTEIIYRIFLKNEKEEKIFWIATEEPIVIPPYSSCLVMKNISNHNMEITNLIKYQIFAVTNDVTIELNKNINCYDKPCEN